MHSKIEGNGDDGWRPGRVAPDKLLFSLCTFCGIRKMLYMFTIKLQFLLKEK